MTSMKTQVERTYLALGDSTSIDLYTGVVGGGAVATFFRSLGPGWRLQDHTVDGCTIDGVPRDWTGDLITLTIGGNDLLLELEMIRRQGLGRFGRRHRGLLDAIRARNPAATFVVGNVYAPQVQLERDLLRLLDQANQIIADNARAAGAKLADIRSAFRGNELRYLCKIIEPSLEGASAIAALFEQSATEDKEARRVIDEPK